MSTRTINSASGFGYFGEYEGHTLELEVDPSRVRHQRLIVYYEGRIVGKTTWVKHNWAFMCRARAIIQGRIKK